MKDRFIITTTDTIENCQIEVYIGAICSNIVLGVNVFSEAVASFNDFWGGRSSSYEGKLEKMYNNATEALKNKAIAMGANAIVGLKVDFDEISGKGKEMFMISASGTACIVKCRMESVEENEKYRSFISNDELQIEMTRRHIISQIKNREVIKDEWARFLLEFPQEEIAEDLIKLYSTLDDSCVNKDKVKNIICAMPIDYIIPYVYEYFEKEIIVDLIIELGLFDADRIYNIIQERIHDGIYLLRARKNHYSRQDLQGMKRILEYLDNLPNTGTIKEVKDGLFSKKYKNIFICSNGHENPEDQVFCKKCFINIKGINIEESDIIEEFRETCNIISEYIA